MYQFRKSPEIEHVQKQEAKQCAGHPTHCARGTRNIMCTFVRNVSNLTMVAEELSNRVRLSLGKGAEKLGVQGWEEAYISLHSLLQRI